MLGNPLAAALKPIQQLAASLPDQLRAALRDVMAPMVPPAGAEPIYWSARATVAAATDEEWGVQWVPGVDSTAAGASSNSFRIVADSPEDAGGNESLASRQRFLPGFRGMVWAECLAGNTLNAAIVGAPQLQATWSVFHNGNAVPGMLRQHVGGTAWREIAAGNVNMAMGFARSELPCPVPLEQGDTMAIHLHNGLGSSLDMLVRVWGWRWR